MATPYCTPAQLTQVIGRDHLIAAAPDPDRDDAWDAATVAAALDAVSERVDARLAHAELVEGRHDSTDLIHQRATDAWAIVDGVAEGTYRLDVDDDDHDGDANPRTRQGRVIRVRGRDRWFPRNRPTGAI